MSTSVDNPAPKPVETEPFDEQEYRRRQRKSAQITGIALGAVIVLIFAVTIVKMSLATAS